MTPGSLIARLRAVGAKLDAQGLIVWPAEVPEAERFFLSNGVKRHRAAVIASFSRPEPSPEVAAMLAEVEQLGGLGAANLIEDARAGRIRPDDLWRWVRDWHRKRSLMQAGEGRR